MAMNAQTTCKIGIAIGLCNYVLYALMSYLVGGDTLHGRILDGHYFIAAGGGLIEVSRALFLFSRWEAYSLIATFPLGLLCACFLSPAQSMQDAEQGIDLSLTAIDRRQRRAMGGQHAGLSLDAHAGHRKQPAMARFVDQASLSVDLGAG
jgi:hypothetical protein